MDRADASPDLKDYAERFQNAVSTTNKKLIAWISGRLEDGLTGQQCFILKQISESERMTSSILAERMEVKPSAITVMIERLVHNGFVERFGDSADRRVTILKLTDKGAKALESIRKQFLSVLAKLLGELDEAEIEPFLRTFERVALAVAKLD